jgi:hypothetical protein
MLNSKQKDFISYLLKTGQIIASCEHAGITRRTYYNWLHIEEFAIELRKQRNFVYENGLNKVMQEKNIQKQIDKLEKQTLFRVPSIEEFKKQLLSTKEILSHSTLTEKRKIVWMFINSITLDPIERKVTAEFYFDPFRMLMEQSRFPKKQMESSFEPSTKMVAGTGFEPATFGL